MEGQRDDKVKKIRVTTLPSAGDSRICNLSDSTLGSHDKPTIDDLLHPMHAGIPAMRCQ